METEKGSFPFDKLLLATGGKSFIPPMQGADSPGVFTLKTLADADRIKQAAAQAKTAVLIGGGLLGLEAGNGLRKLGLKVIVVEFFPRLLPRQMDVAGAAILQSQMEDMGFTFHLGAMTEEIVSGPEGLTGLPEKRREDHGRPGAHFRGGAAGSQPGPGPGIGSRQRG